MGAYEFLTAIVLGIVEGVTEFLPISSTGHLIIAGRILHFEGVKAETFEIFIQLGAILSIVFLYLPRFQALVDFRPNQTKEFRGFVAMSRIAVACLPAFILGFLLHHIIKEHLFSPWTVALALIVGGIVMMFVDKAMKAPTTSSIEKITIKQAFLVGCFQCFALWPGMSRSASTIVGGLIGGLSRTVAAEFSFLVAVPIMFAATALDLIKSREALSWSDIPLFAVGFLVSFFVAVVAVRSFLKYLAKHTLRPFGIYRIGVGMVVLVLLGLKIL